MSGKNQQASMRRFHITHRGIDGTEYEYFGLFKSSIEAIKDCVATFGMGKVKVVAL